MSERSSAGSFSIDSAPAAGYAGDVDATQTWEILKNIPEAVLVDVRTRAEWNYVGVPVLEELGKQTVLVEWQSYPSGDLNPSFADELESAGVARDATVLFICRSGARSAAAAAAMTSRGYQTCYNVSGGFEGPHDQQQHRGAIDGWKAQGLPWTQG